VKVTYVTSPGGDNRHAKFSYRPALECNLCVRMVTMLRIYRSVSWLADSLVQGWSWSAAAERAWLTVNIYESPVRRSPEGLREYDPTG